MGAQNRPREGRRGEQTRLRRRYEPQKVSREPQEEPKMVSWLPRSSQETPKSIPEEPKSLRRGSQEHPKGAQEHSKRGLGSDGRPTRAPKRTPRAPKRKPNQPKDDPKIASCSQARVLWFCRGLMLSLSHAVILSSSHANMVPFAFSLMPLCPHVFPMLALVRTCTRFPFTR